MVEIEDYCRRTQGKDNNLIVKKLEFKPLAKIEIEEEIKKIEQEPSIDEVIPVGHVIIAKVNPQNNHFIRTNIHKMGVVSEAQNPNKHQGFYSSFLNIYTVRLDGTNRLNLLNEQKAGDLKKVPTNHLTHLFQNNAMRKKVRCIIYAAFCKYFVIDPTNITTLLAGDPKITLIDEPEAFLHPALSNMLGN